MQEAERKSRNVAMLGQCHPWIRPKLAAIVQDLEAHAFRPRIQCAWRSPKEQLDAYTSGHSKLKFGFHNVTTADGHANSMAVDVLDDDNPISPPRRFLLMLASSAISHGLATGIAWGLPVAMRKSIATAISAKNWDAPVKVGWDPCHVEPVGITPKQAQSGSTPTS